jgi:hypothetical protein
MSDYQEVRVLKKKGRILTLEVVEDNPDIAALSAIIEEGSLREDSETDAIKLAAILLLDEKGRSGDIAPPDDEDPTPEQFVEAVELVSAEQIGKSSNDDPRYRAVLNVTLTEDGYAEAFEVDESWGAAADLGGDFEDCFS